jgi:hypothetical protein
MALAAAAWGGLAGFGEEQFGVDLAAGGLQPPVPLSVGPLDRWGWAGELLAGGGQPLGERRLAGLAAQLPGDMAHVAIGDPQPPGELAGAQWPAARILLVPELGDPLGGGRRAGAQLRELVADAALVAAQLPGELARTQPLGAADLAGPVAAFHLGGQPLRINRAAGDGGLLMAAAGEVGLELGELLGGRLAVACRLGQDLQALGAGVLGAESG